MRAGERPFMPVLRRISWHGQPHPYCLGFGRSLLAAQVSNCLAACLDRLSLVARASKCLTAPVLAHHCWLLRYQTAAMGSYQTLDLIDTFLNYQVCFLVLNNASTAPAVGVSSHACMGFLLIAGPSLQVFGLLQGQQ